MKKSIGPRRHPVPERFTSIVEGVPEPQLAELSTSLLNNLQSGMTPAAAAEIETESGWDREFLDWLADFTYAQRRSIVPMTESAFQAFQQLDSIRDYRRYLLWWGIGHFTLGVCLMLFGPVASFYNLNVLVAAASIATLITGYRFFAIFAGRERSHPVFSGLGILTTLAFGLLSIAIMFMFAIGFPS